MKAVRIHGPGKVSIDEVPIREPGEHDVLIKVKAAGLFGTDYELYTNDMVYITEGLAKLPIIPGHEWSGIVEKVGKKVSKFKEAALIKPTGIGLNAVIRGGVTPLDNVLVMGSSPIGLQTAQIAKKVYGTRKVILSGIRDERIERAGSYGLDGTINVRKENLKEKDLTSWSAEKKTP